SSGSHQEGVREGEPVHAQRRRARGPRGASGLEEVVGLRVHSLSTKRLSLSSVLSPRGGANGSASLRLPEKLHEQRDARAPRAVQEKRAHENVRLPAAPHRQMLEREDNEERDERGK